MTPERITWWAREVAATVRGRPVPPSPPPSRSLYATDYYTNTERDAGEFERMRNG